MFDIGFMELVLIGIVALLVVGPERLPGAIRTATLWIGRAKRSFNEVKAEIEKEINADEIKRQLHNESILADIKKAKVQADKLVANTKQSVEKINSDVKATLAEEESQLKESLADAPTKPREKPAAPVADPASIDEPAAEDDNTAEEIEVLASEDEPEAVQGPVEDFYNNPPSGTIRVSGRDFLPTSSLDDETDSGRRS